MRLNQWQTEAIASDKVANPSSLTRAIIFSKIIAIHRHIKPNTTRFNIISLFRNNNNKISNNSKTTRINMIWPLRSNRFIINNHIKWTKINMINPFRSNISLSMSNNRNLTRIMINLINIVSLYKSNRPFRPNHHNISNFTPLLRNQLTIMTSKSTKTPSWLIPRSCKRVIRTWSMRKMWSMRRTWSMRRML